MSRKTVFNASFLLKKLFPSLETKESYSQSQKSNAFQCNVVLGLQIFSLSFPSQLWDNALGSPLIDNYQNPYIYIPFMVVIADRTVV